jgi:uncharacterized protein involved in exopolysaccharide biosynthesis
MPFSEGLGVLEPSAIGLREEIAAGVERVEAARDAAGKRRPASKAVRRPGISAMQELQRQSAERQRRQLEDLETQLREVQKTFTGGHPAVLELQHSIELLKARQGDTPELQKQLQTPTRKLPAAAQQLASATTAEIEDAPIEQAKEDLRFAMSKYMTLLDRIDNAQMSLRSAQANFKHRFSVVTPAELPRAPIKPKQPAVLLGGIIGGLLLAVFLSALRDLRRGLVFERWQVLRELGIPVLGEIHQ